MTQSQASDKRALVVDDDADVARLTVRFLSRRGWRAEASHSVSAALEIFASGRYGLLICDIDLPDGDGVSLAEKLREIDPALVIVMFSGSPQNLERARRSGFSRCLRKPYDFDELTALTAEDLSAGPLRILLVEDDLRQLAQYGRFLEDEGYAVIPVTSAEKALRTLSQGRFDAIVADNVLPGMTGLEALPQLTRSGSPVVLMSAQYTPETEEAARLLGAAAFAKKPLSSRELSRLVKDACPAKD